MAEAGRHLRAGTPSFYVRRGKGDTLMCRARTVPWPGPVPLRSDYQQDFRDRLCTLTREARWVCEGGSSPSSGAIELEPNAWERGASRTSLWLEERAAARRLSPLAWPGGGIPGLEQRKRRGGLGETPNHRQRESGRRGRGSRLVLPSRLSGKGPRRTTLSVVENVPVRGFKVRVKRALGLWWRGALFTAQRAKKRRAHGREPWFFALVFPEVEKWNSHE